MKGRLKSRFDKRQNQLSMIGSTPRLRAGWLPLVGVEWTEQERQK